MLSNKFDALKDELLTTANIIESTQEVTEKLVHLVKV